MERSSKHGPRQDEALARETQGLLKGEHATRAEEWRSSEPPGEDQPDATLAPDASTSVGTPEGMTPADVELRAEIAQVLGRSVYPADRDALVATAEGNQAPDAVLERLRGLPAQDTFASLAEVVTALGMPVEPHRG